MQWHEYQICGKVHTVLEICELDVESIFQAGNPFSTIKNVQLGLSIMDCLTLFDRIEVLVLTGGIPSKAGLEALYSCSELTSLILDYEETDSDEDALVLANFPYLCYVLSASNLNIKCPDTIPNDLDIEVLNEYRNGKIIRRGYSSVSAKLKVPHAFFFSTESETPASTSIMEILKAFERIVDPQMRQGKYSQRLKTIAIIPICISNRLKLEGFGRERRYVSIKQQRADIRLQINFEEFILSSFSERVALCQQCILRGAKYLQQKDETFQLEKFTEDLSLVASTITSNKA